MSAAGVPPGATPLQQLRACVAIIHSGVATDRGNADRQAADRWLRAFQRTHDAWAVAHQLLEDPAASVRELFTAAMTLHSKVSRDFGDLNAQAVGVLRQTLLKHIARLSNVRPTPCARLDAHAACP